jgi:hypothetical protein
LGQILSPEIMVKILSFICSLFLSVNCFAQTYWRIENDRGEDLLLTININAEDMTFETYTRKNALKEMAGSLMYMVAKAAGKIQYPELMHGDGKVSFNADTTNYTGIINYPDKQFSLHAKTWNNRFYGILTDNKNRSTVLTGEKVSSDKPLKDYSILINNLFSLTEKFYWDAGIQNNSEWKNFKSEVNNSKLKIADDYELAMTTMWLGKKLNQIPHEIKKWNKKDLVLQSKRHYAPGIIDAKKAVLNLSNIPDTREETDQIFNEIREKNITTLILNAAGVRNLSLYSALLLAGHLTAQTSSWGIFLTRRWTDLEKTIPTPDLYQKMLKNPFEISDFENKSCNEKGFYLTTKPSLPIFKGKVYMLVNKGTSNVAEVLAIYFKNEKIATLVGQKTAGTPCLTGLFEVDKLYHISIPFARYYDKNEKSYQGIGIDPDLIEEKNLLEYALKL